MKKKKMRICLGALLCLCFFLCMKTEIWAAESKTGDLKVSGGEYGEDYRFEEHTLVVLTDRPLTVSGETRKDGIRVKEGTDAVLTLKDLDMRVSSGCALDAGDGKVTLKLSGSNYIKSGAKYAGIFVREGAKVTISGGKKDTLMVFGGSQAAGIGSDKETAFGEIVISGGTITATGGARAAGIGNGFNGGGGSIRLESGRITAYGGAGAADLGAPQESSADARITLDGNVAVYADDILDEVTQTKGILFSRSKGNVQQDVLLSYPLEIPRGQRLVIPADSGLEISSGVDCVNQGEIYVYGSLKVQGSLRNQGEIYDYGGASDTALGITGNEVLVCDIHDIALSNGSLVFTEEGYEQNGMEFRTGDSGHGMYTLKGEAEEIDAGISVEDGVSVELALQDVKLAPEESGYALNVGENAQVTLFLKGENSFRGGTNALSGSILTGKDAVLKFGGTGELTLEGMNGSKVVLRGNGQASEELSEEELSPEEMSQGEEENSGDVSEEDGLSVNVTEDGKQMETWIDREVLSSLVDDRRELDINGELLRIRLDWRAVREILDNTAGNVKFRVRPFVLDEKFPNAKFYIGERPVYDIHVIDETEDGEEIVTIHFSEGKATLAIPYRKAAGEENRRLYLVYVGADNTVEWFRDSYYDADTREIVSEVKHFSVYGVGYQ